MTPTTIRCYGAERKGYAAAYQRPNGGRTFWKLQCQYCYRMFRTSMKSLHYKQSKRYPFEPGEWIGIVPPHEIPENE